MRPSSSVGLERQPVTLEVVGSSPIWVAIILALVAQSVEQRTENPRVGGSIPPQGTIVMRKWLSGRASPCQGEGRGFKSRLPLHFVSLGGIAKW